MTSKILVLENNTVLSDKLNTLLRNNGYITASTCEYGEAKRLMKATLFDLVIAECPTEELMP